MPLSLKNPKVIAGKLPAAGGAMQLVQLQREVGQYLTLAGIPDGRREAAQLLAHILKVDLTAIYARLIAKIDEPIVLQIRKMAERRANHEPLAYITGSVFFCDLEFYVGTGVLVPRPDSEVLVETALAACDQLNDGPLDVLDACAGTGCIGISLASRLLEKKRLNSLILTEIDDDAADFASRNLERHPLDGRASLVMADLFPADDSRRWDLIISNPPYIASAEIAALMPEVSIHEPRMALDGGQDGLDFYRRLIADAAGRLKPGGALLLEHGFDQADALAGLFAADGRYEPIQLVRDYGGQPRVSGGFLLPGK